MTGMMTTIATGATRSTRTTSRSTRSPSWQSESDFGSLCIPHNFTWWSRLAPSPVGQLTAPSLQKQCLLLLLLLLLLGNGPNMYRRVCRRYAAFQCNAQCQINEVWYCIGRDSEVRNVVLRMPAGTVVCCIPPTASASDAAQLRVHTHAIRALEGHSAMCSQIRHPLAPGLPHWPVRLRPRRAGIRHLHLPELHDRADSSIRLSGSAILHSRGW